jgi:diguanylate cyclase (GGDEF)-like protein
MTSAQPNNIRFSLVIIILVLLIFLGGIFLGLAIRTRTLLHETILSQARSHFQNIVLTRSWNAQQGGVYVRKTKGMESNPYLENPDIVTRDGQVYTKKNPALMTREISELAAQKDGMRFHITSLKPLNPDNRADPFETAALQAFENGKQEVSQLAERDGRPILRYMAPLVTTSDCLDCHRQQGYKVGDIRGGISVSIPIQELQQQLQRNMLAIGLYGIVVTLALVLTIYLLIVRMVRLLNQARATVEKLAVSDGLTGIYNRRHGMELLTIELSKAQRLGHPLCCLLIDIDYFKQINDSYGHAAGDQVLIGVTAELQKELRRYDILFRYGGEEFVVIFPGQGLGDARGCAERLRQACADLQVPIDTGKQSIQVTLSGGLTTLREGEDSSEAILKRADIALYQAKDGGRNRINEML